MKSLSSAQVQWQLSNEREAYSLAGPFCLLSTAWKNPILLACGTVYVVATRSDVESP